MVIDFLILNSKCPRSLYFSVEKISYHLKRLKNYYKDNKIFSAKIEYLFRRLKKLTVNDILEEGLHDFLTRFIDDISIVYKDMEKKFFLGT